MNQHEETWIEYDAMGRRIERTVVVASLPAYGERMSTITELFVSHDWGMLNLSIALGEQP